MESQNRKETDHGFGFRHLTSSTAREASTLVKKSAAITIGETQSHLYAVKSRMRQEISSFPETEEVEAL